MVMSPDQNAGRRHSINKVNKSSEILEQFRYFGAAVTDQNYIQEEIRADCSEGMFAIIRRTICRLPVRHQ